MLIGVLVHLSETTREQLTERCGFPVTDEHLRELADHNIVVHRTDGAIFPAPVREPDFAIHAGPRREPKRRSTAYDIGREDRYPSTIGGGRLVREA